MRKKVEETDSEEAHMPASLACITANKRKQQQQLRQKPSQSTIKSKNEQPSLFSYWHIYNYGAHMPVQ